MRVSELTQLNSWRIVLVGEETLGGRKEKKAGGQESYSFPIIKIQFVIHVGEIG